MREASVLTRVGQNRSYTLYMTVHLVISLPGIPCIHRIYLVLANPSSYQFRKQRLNGSIRCGVLPLLALFLLLPLCRHKQINTHESTKFLFLPFFSFFPCADTSKLIRMSPQNSSSCPFSPSSPVQTHKLIRMSPQNSSSCPFSPSSPVQTRANQHA